MKAVAIIQARMGSTRLPGKVLQDIRGKTMLARVLERAGQASTLDTIVVATTTDPADEAVVEECGRVGITSFRGSPQDVLDRYYRAAKVHRAEVVVRITSDCPLLDPEIVDRVVERLRKGGRDYVSNTVERSFPLGLDVEAFKFPALQKAAEEAKKDYERAHVTPYIWQHPDQFRIAQVKARGDFSRHRWTVDTAEDLEFVREVYERLTDTERFRWRDVLDLVTADSSLEARNRHVHQKALEEG